MIVQKMKFSIEEMLVSNRVILERLAGALQGKVNFMAANAYKLNVS